jgi:hypothetical protein
MTVSSLLRLTSVPGDGLLRRDGDLVLLASTNCASSAVDELLATWAAVVAADSDDRGFVRRIAGWLATTETDELPSFAAVRVSADAVTVLVRGDAEIVAWTADVSQTVGGQQSAAWVDRSLARPVDRVVISCAPGATTATDRWTDLVAGVVLASAAVAVLVATEAVAGVEDIADADITTETEVETDAATDAAVDDGLADEVMALDPTDEVASSVLLIDATPDPDREPLPLVADARAPQHLVLGAMCKNGHFNDPRGAFCGLCGISMVQQTLNLVEGPRPPLGVLVLDDGMTFRVDDDYVIGREPQTDELVVRGEARPLVINDEGGTISRCHAWLRVDGWDVQVVDRGSANGTYVARPGELAWEPVTADAPVSIEPGTRLRLGQRTMVFDGHFRI